MGTEKTVTFYLPSKLRRQAENGNHNFITKVSDVLTSSGLAVDFDADDDAARLRALARPGRSMFLMNEPVDARGLVFRKTYFYPFWHIEAQGKRWEWPVAQERFDPVGQNARKTANFYRFWRTKLFGEEALHPASDGYVYVPLQGMLTKHRSFQFCSPIEMIEQVMTYEKTRHVVISLHPGELYDKAEEDALEALLAKHSRLHLQTDVSGQYLQNCDYVVTQNSSVGFKGYFYGKPLILFGQIDFHHIALKVAEIGLQEAFSAVNDHAPDYAAYVYWFLQLRAINAGRPEAMIKIRSVLRRHGWPV